MNIGVFEDSGYQRLLPLTWLRTCFELRCGVDRLIDKLQSTLGGQVTRYWVRPALQPLVERNFPTAAIDPAEHWVLVNARAMLTERIDPPPVGYAWVKDGAPIVVGVRSNEIDELTADLLLSPPTQGETNPSPLSAWLRRFRCYPPPASIKVIDYPWQPALLNGEELRRQCRHGGAQEGTVHPGAHLVNPAAIQIAAGAVIKPGVVLDASDGPIRIDADALIQPNAVLEGPCYIGPATIIRPGASIRANSSIGPVCRIGGEIEGSIIHGLSNKQHDGFLGHSYVAEWVNLGADTVTSDLKNTYGTIRVSLCGRPVESGERFIGSIIGDHAKTGIGTILPTGCVLGTASNVFTRGRVPGFVPSFGWLTDESLAPFRVDKAVEIARTVMSRRKVELGALEQALLLHSAAQCREIEAPGWQPSGK